MQQMTSPELLPKLKRLHLRGFKSIESLELDFSALDVLIGPNGAGKSSLVGFLQMIGFMLSTEAGLGTYVGLAGGASSLLHDGPKRTPQIEATLTISTALGLNDYYFRLGHAAGDSLIFLEEKCRFSASNRPTLNDRWIEFGAGHRSPMLLSTKNEEDVTSKTRRVILSVLQGLSVYQFHDTSRQAPIKQKARISDGRYLRGNGANLAPFLMRMRAQEPEFYQRIIKTIRLVAPFFDDFVFEDEGGFVLLRWKEVGTDVVFGPEQISDGSLRLIALVALLLQSPKTLRPMLIIDEPELGLHPAATRIVAGAIRAVAESHQCLIATQSQILLDEFSTDNVVVVERLRRGSSFHRLREDELKNWLNEYALSELWDMNVLGGRPRPLAAE